MGVFDMKKERKQKLFLLMNTLLWCAIGALFWFVIGNRLAENNLLIICFIGYPGVFLGIVGGFIYLVNHDR